MPIDPNELLNKLPFLILQYNLANKQNETQLKRDKLTAVHRDTMVKFAEAERIRDDKFKSATLDYRAKEKERADEIRLTNTKRLDAADERDFQYQTKMLASKLITQKQNSMAMWGVDVLDDAGQPIPVTIVDPNDSNKRIPNPILVARGANFSLDGTRLISLQERVLDIKSQNVIEQTIGLQTEQLKLAKINEANIAPIDPLLFDPEEPDWGGKGWFFDEEDALKNLRNEKMPLWGKTVDLMSALPEDNAKRIHVLSSIQKLHSELVGKKYASATGGLALEKGKYGTIRSSLASQLEGYINRLGGEINQDSGLIDKVTESGYSHGYLGYSVGVEKKK